MSENKSSRIAVVGAGITGLTAAYLLSRQGYEVVIYESGEVGGLVQSPSIDGFTLEAGANVFNLKPAIEQLLTELGMRQDVVFPVIERYRQYVWSDSEAAAVPQSLGGFLRSDLFTPREKFRIVTRVFRRNQLFTDREDLSVADFFNPLLGERLVGTLIDPVLKGIFGGDVRSLSARTLFSGLWESAAEGLSVVQHMKRRRKQGHKKPPIFVLRGGNKRLADRLLECSRDNGALLVNDSVESLRVDDGKWELSCSGGQITSFDATFLSTAGPQTGEILKEFCPSETIEKFRTLSAAPLAVVHLKLEDLGELPKDGFGVLFPSSAKAKVLGVMTNSVLFPHVAPSGSNLVTVCLGGVGDRDAVTLSDEELRDRVFQELSERFKVPPGEVINIKRWRAAIPQLEVGHQRYVDSLKALEQKYAGLHFLGTDFGGVGVPDRVDLVYRRLEELGFLSEAKSSEFRRAA